MSTRFRKRIRDSLADANLQSALDANAERRIAVRQVAFGSLLNPESSRARAHRVRADVIKHLDSYVTQFAEHAEHNGIQIHRAADAEQAVQIVLDIAHQKGARLIAKSKTMVSEEIHLNHALEADGLQVVETDLGEYIVQLRGETPAHIITPAVHLRRQDVGKLFEQRLGIPYTEDIRVMTEVARRTLRQVFMNAEIGISGVNFGVAESGTLCIVTNEGNGRMVTTLPSTHIALMGTERLVPTLDDLALMLSLLARSATGQKLSVYTSLLNSPRRATDPDGPQERHVILVDNGRLAVRGSDLEEILYCIRCGSCLNACPVFREIGGHAYIGAHGEGSPYPGPIGSVISPALFGQPEFGQLARASSLCGACREACPVDINLPKLLLRVRAGLAPIQNQQEPKPNAPTWMAAGIRVFSLAATSPWRFDLAMRLFGLMGALSTTFSRSTWMRLPAFTGWGYSKDFPRPASRPFHSRFSSLNKTNIENQSRPPAPIDSPIPSSPPSEDPNREPAALVKKFSTELEALGGMFYSCVPGDVTQVVLEILKSRGIDEILAWDEEHLPGSIWDNLSRAGIHIIFPNMDDLHDNSHIKAGLSGATAAIAETGSLVLLGGPGMPLSASLLPEIHIALLSERDMVERLDQALQLEGIKSAPACVLVTGPSRTADIEMTLTIGVHGPGELHVICILDDGSPV